MREESAKKSKVLAVSNGLFFLQQRSRCVLMSFELCLMRLFTRVPSIS
jgi:hypothetical protein